MVVHNLSNFFTKKIGVAGGGVEICVTLFVSEIADNEYDSCAHLTIFM